ncbi:MAG: ISKra4 family transposase, partial [Deltaproteobacteria bacterium]|nr:ISKra4 family transposase [Deltaproteobacteria bacterium]
GLPIATGVIEGACRHLVKDRMAITGARWDLPMAEAVLRLRALQVNDHWGAYLRFHLERESFRNHSDPRVAEKAA